MPSILESKFWSNLFKKIVRIIAKRADLDTSRETHHQHVVPHEDGWAIKGEGNSKYTAIYELQEDAIERAKEIAKNYRSSVIIHGRDGSIRDRIHYG